MSTETPSARRWWWLVGAVGVVALALWLWPGHAPRKTKVSKPTRPQIVARPLVTFGPNGWQVGPRRGLGPIAIAPPAAGLVRVTGTVIDRTTRKPVPDVEVVFADGSSEASAIADLAGRYSIDVPPGRYRPFVRGDSVISAAAPVRERLPARPRPEQVAAARLDLAAALDLSRSTEGVDLEVVRAGRVRGRVIDSTGKPIAGAIVRAFATDDYAAVRPVLGTDVAETDAAGGFTLDVAATTYRIDAFHDRYGGVASYAVVAVEAGQTAEAEITMMAGCVIAGRIVRADGQPPGTGAIERGASDTDASGTYFPDGEFNEDGTFVWSTSEEMTLYLRAWPWKSAPSQPRRFQCKDGVRYTDIVFEIPRAEPDLSGRVVTADGRPVPFAFVDVGGESDGTMNQQERADADGNWAVYALPSGQYRVATTAEGVGMVVTHVSAPARGIELRMSGTGALAGKVTGVTDGALELSAQSCAQDSGDGMPVEFRRVVSVTGGQYQLDGVPACDQLDVVAIHLGQTVRMSTKVPAGGLTTLDFDFPDDKPVLVRGVVRDADHRPVAAAYVVASSRDAGETSHAETDVDGRFTLEAHAGDAIIVHSATGFTSVDLDKHGPSTVDLELTIENAMPLDDEPTFDGD